MSPASDQSGKDSPGPEHQDQVTISRRPTIVVHKAESTEASLESTETTPEPATMDKVPEKVRGPLSCDPETPKPLDAHHLPQSPAEGSYIPKIIDCSIRVIFKGSQLAKVSQPAKVLPVFLDKSGGYQEIERVAEEHAETLSANDLGTKELKFQYGNCTLVSDAGAESRQPLRSSEDWTEVIKAVGGYWTSHIGARLHLYISRYYSAIQEQPTLRISKVKKLEIYDRMIKTWEKRAYIPQDVLEMVISNNIIRLIIKENPPRSVAKEQQDAFIHRVQAEGRILLAMWVHTSLEMDCLKKLLDSGFKDSTLPLADEHQCHEDCRSDFQQLVQAQGGYQAERFVEGEHKTLLPHAVVPLHFYPRDHAKNDLDREVFKGYGNEPPNLLSQGSAIKEAARCGQGAYSDVYCVKFNSNHHSLSVDLDTCFALKEFKDRPKSVKHFIRELAILKELRKYSHPHIVTHLATWTQDEKYYMLFPYAQCNLREYMTKSRFAAEDAFWLLDQFRGMAGAVKRIHDLSEEPPTSNLSVKTPATEERRTGWHHDIKPENILFFKENCSSRGMLRISDWGSAKVNTYRTRSYHTQFPIGTLTYEPPEFTHEGKASRPYDLWSLGCVFLELLIWAVFGPTDLTKFTDERDDKRSANAGTGDTFWQRDGRGIVLQATVIAHLQRLEIALTEPDAPPFKEVVGYVKRMLQTESDKRIRALELYDSLDRIITMKKIEEKFPTDVSEPVERISLIPTNPQSPDATVHGPAFAENYDLSPLDISPRTNRHSRNSSASELMPSHPTHSRQSSNGSTRSTLSVRERRGSHSSANSARTTERGT